MSERRQAAQPDAARFARWLKDPSNNIGFRDEREHQLVMANRLRFASELVGGDPAGITFRNSAERVNWLRGQRERIDFDEAQTLWSIAKGDYDKCMSGGGRNCHDPGPPPQR